MYPARSKVIQTVSAIDTRVTHTHTLSRTHTQIQTYRRGGCSGRQQTKQLKEKSSRWEINTELRIILMLILVLIKCRFNVCFNLCLMRLKRVVVVVVFIVTSRSLRILQNTRVNPLICCELKFYSWD